MKHYEVLDHTADVGIKAHGEDLSQAFENAAQGMFDIISDVEQILSIGEYDVTLSSQDIEQLLVDWLSELLFIHTVKQVLFARFEIVIKEEHGQWLLKGKAMGEDYNPEKHPYHTEIKAVTHHMLEIKEDNGYQIRVLFDI
jgi:SHS2 domain-containing protein